MKEKTVIVTGGSRGLGLTFVRSLLAQNYRVATCSRRRSAELDDLLSHEEVRRRLRWEPFEVGSGDAGAFVDAVSSWCGAENLYALVNNAGVAAEGVLATFPLVEIERILRINLQGPLQISRAFLRILLRHNGGGRVINVSSIVGTRAYSGLAAYSASKAGIDGMTRALAREVGKREITVNSIAPGYLRTEMSASLDEAKIRLITRRTPLRRLATEDDITPVLLFLLSDGARFITGQTIVVDGGTLVLREMLRDRTADVLARTGLSSLATRVLHPQGSLRVLIYHDVPPRLLNNFSRHIEWLSKKFEFVQPADLLGEQQIGERPKLLLTFDDGCSDNYELVAPFLENMGIRALFFVCPGFAGLDNVASYALMERSAHLLGQSNGDSRWMRLSRSQLIDLERRGHSIGNHTMTHAPLAHLEPRECLKEVQESADLLSDWLGHPCHFFAWTYSCKEVTEIALRAALNRHALCFSPCSGLNTWPTRARLLWRTAVDLSRPLAWLESQLCGVVDYAYRRRRRALGELYTRSSFCLECRNDGNARLAGVQD